MTLTANIAWDESVIESLQLYAQKSKEQFKFCAKCGWPFVTCKAYQEDICVECSNMYHTWDRERRLKEQREYARKYKRVRVDRRRKEHKNT